MCAYDTTVLDTVESRSHEPACLARDGLTSKYFPETSRPLLALIVCLCAVFLFTSLNRLNHTDLWAHLSYGRWITGHAALPESDPFAAEASTRPFVNVPWLTQVAFYSVHTAAGEEGLVLLHALLATLAYGLFALAVYRRGASLAWATAGAATAYVLALPIVGTIRPQLCGMVGIVLVLLACTALPRRWHPLLWLPPIFTIWSNLHGSFPVGLTILGLYVVAVACSVVAETRSVATAARDGRLIRSVLACGLSLAASCLNPLGPRLLLQVAVFGRQDTLANISEWQPLVIGSFSGILFFSSLLVSGVLLRFSPRKVEVFEVLLVLFFAAAALAAMRMLVWWAFVWVWVSVPHASAAWRGRRAAGSQRVAAFRSPREASMRTLYAVGVIFVVLLMAPPSHALISSRPRGIASLVSRETPLYVADEICRRGLEGRVFAPMDWADYLTWRAGGRARPLVYSHVHLIDSRIWHDYLRIAQGDDDWLRLARQHQLGYLVISRQRNRKLLRAVFKATDGPNPTARIIYQDQRSVLVELAA